MTPPNNPVSDAVKLTDEHRIDLIRNLRNDLIKDFLNEQNLVAYFEQHLNRKELNNRRIEFIKKELRDLLIAPVDLAHYATLMIEMKQNGTATLTGKNDKLFYDELEKIFRKYAY
jgi:hypothetical protein